MESSTLFLRTSQTTAGPGLLTPRTQSPGRSKRWSHVCDAQLAEASARGDRTAFAEVCNRYFDRLYDFSVRTLQNSSAGESVTRQTFTRAWAQLRGGQKPKSLAAWLFATAREACLLVQSGCGSPASSPHDDGMFAEPACESDSELVSVHEEILDLVWRAAETLDRGDYALLDMRVRQGLTADEIAKAIGSKPGIVRIALDSALAKLGLAVRGHLRTCTICGATPTVAWPEAVLASMVPIAPPTGLREALWASLDPGRTAPPSPRQPILARNVGRLQLALVGAALVVVAGFVVLLQPCSQQESAHSDSPIESGFAFVGGRYLAPPYQVIADGQGLVRLNGEVVWQPDRPPSEPPAPFTGTPQNVDEVVEAGAKWMRDHWRDHAQPPPAGLFDELKAYIGSLAPVRTVDDDGTTLRVTDQRGNTAHLVYRRVQPASPEPVAAEGSAFARRLQDTLEAGGVVVISSGVAVEVPGARAEEFLSQIAWSMRAPLAAQRAELLGRFVPPAVSEDFLAAGFPEDALRQRLPGLHPLEPLRREGHDETVIKSQEAVNGRAPANLAAFPDGHVPGSDNAIFWLVEKPTSGALDPVREAVAKLHHYTVIEYNRDWNYGRRNLVAKDFIWALANAGVLYISAHGSPDGIEIDRYWCKNPGVLCSGSAQGALDELRKLVPGGIEAVDTSGQKITGDIGYLGKSPTGNLGPISGPDYWGVYLSAADIQTISRVAMRQGGARNVLIELESCSSISLAPHFLTADDVVGGNETLETVGAGGLWIDDAADFNKEFWPRMSGVVGKGTKRWVAEAFRDTPATKFAHRGSGLTMLSPVVKDVTPARGSEVPVGVEFEVRVRFATAMWDGFVDAQIAVADATGECEPERTSRERWIDDHTLSFKVKVRKAGSLLLSVNKAPAKDNRIYQDGNSGKDGEPSGVGPNEDSFVWKVTCVNRPPTATATPAIAVPPTSTPAQTAPTPTATPSPTATSSPSPSPTQASGPRVSGSYSGTVPVLLDPAGHACCVKPASTWNVLQVRNTQTNVISITLSGMLPGIALTSVIPNTGASFTATDKGTVAGYPDVSVSFSGNVTPEGGVKGVLTVGANGAFPGGQPITFTVNLQKP